MTNISDPDENRPFCTFWSPTHLSVGLACPALLLAPLADASVSAGLSGCMTPAMGAQAIDDREDDAVVDDDDALV